METGGNNLEWARQRKRNAVRAVNDALVELQVADRLLEREIDMALGSPGRVAAAPAGFTSPLVSAAEKHDTVLDLGGFECPSC